ncbi:Cof-type HAD-IIB family hydrolase [Clostridium mediterraneense]|uniref:Cof-type HAD-IIB family hydrolase n=1 Tax=Clostridium mediterraneense TaxID=1805472 RepID=UPI00082FD82C|nr:Cof-type HAD-IIB family hydrolase [Clostridium mediterraneense]
MKYKLICIDMDGTLLSDKHEVPELNKEMIKEATKQGVKVAITTGRIFTSAKRYSDLIGTDTPIIASNGAYIREKDKDEVIYESNLSKEQFYKILEVIKKYNLNVYFNTCDTMITESVIPDNHAYKTMDAELADEYKIKFKENADFDKVFDEFKGKILKAICIENENKETLNKAKEEMQKYDDLEVVSSWHNNFEVMPKGTSKGNAVKILAQMLGIDREEVICIGDSENDLSMIKYAGLGVAMGNALDIVKENADYITDTNSEAGVGKVIQKFILE